ncbi:MAG: MscS family membrane protein, partial [Gammaproteobacteria bacterium]|jgi:MscS family membrane protein
MDWLSEQFAHNTWVYEVFGIVFVTLLAVYVQRRVLTKLHLGLRKTKTPWDDAFVDSMQRPLGMLTWIVGLAFAAERINVEAPSPLFEAVGPVRDVGVIWAIGWFLVRFIKRAEANILEQGVLRGEPVDRTTLDAVAKLLRVSVMITAALVALQTLGFSVSGVLAFGGIGGIAVGFAAKDLLANFFGGLMIYLDRPFAVGDWVRSPDREVEGTVEEIGWRLTRVRTFDMRPLYVPNSIFATIALENPSRMTNRRIYETVGLRYEDIHHVRAIVSDVTDMLRAHEAIDQNQTMMVNFNKFSPSSLDFFVYTFTKTTSWTKFHTIKEDVLLQISDIIDRHGAEIALPSRSVYLEGESGERLAISEN